MPKSRKTRKQSTRSPEQAAALKRGREARFSDKENTPPPPEATSTKPVTAGLDWKARAGVYLDRARSLAQKLRRKEEKLTKYELELSQLKKVVLPSLRTENQDIHTRLKLAHTESKRLEFCLLGKTSDLAALRTRLQFSQDERYALRKQVKRSKGVLTRAITRTEIKTKKMITFRKLRVKGIYETQTRALVRRLAILGVAEKHIGSVIQDVGASLGVKVKERMSKTQVGRVIAEGGVISDMQLGHAVATSSNIMYSSDATSHKHINYDSRGIVCTFADKSRVALSMGVEASTDHSVDTNIIGTMKVVNRFSDVYNQSPHARRHCLQSLTRLWFSKLRGTYGDHANDVKKGNKTMKEMKDDARNLGLGIVHLRALEPEDMLQLFWGAIEPLKTKLGGEEAWLALAENERADYESQIVDDLARGVGKKLYDAMSPEEQVQKFGHWIIGGCCMHKNMNTVKGGMKEVQDYWKENPGGPIMLPNKGNVAVLEVAAATTGNASTAASTRARETSGAGAVHASMLGGLICKHKDDKKGQQDDFNRYFATQIGKSLTYPDTSNTRYHSHCEAAEVILLHQPVFISFTEYIRDSKDSQKFTNVELNFNRALQDPGTTTEWCILALESQAFGRPYLRQARAHADVNLLKLGPLHKKILAHYQKVHDDMDILIGPDATHLTGTFDGTEYQNPDVIKTVKALIPSLPAFRGAFKAYLSGALTTMGRFASEFAEGGVIDQLTDEEREAYFMHATNNLNESRLGQKRVRSRACPSMTQESSNSRYVYSQNGSAEWAAQNLTEEDHVYVRRAAKERRKTAGKRQKEAAAIHVAAKQSSIAVVKKRKTKTASDTARRVEKRLTVPYISKESDIEKLTVPEMNVQIDIHKIDGKDTMIPIRKLTRTRPGALEHLTAALRRRNAAGLGDPRIALGEAVESVQSVVEDSEDESEDEQDCIMYYSDADAED